MRDVFEVLERDEAAGVDDDSLASVVLGLQVLQNWVEAKAAVLEERTHAPAVRVAAQAKLGRALRTMPATLAAASAGELSATHGRLLMSCSTDITREQFAQDEEQLVGYAKAMRAREFNQVIRVWAGHGQPPNHRAAGGGACEPGLPDNAPGTIRALRARPVPRRGYLQRR